MTDAGDDVDIVERALAILAEEWAAWNGRWREPAPPPGGDLGPSAPPAQSQGGGP
jgi:hypothetical protein